LSPPYILVVLLLEPPPEVLGGVSFLVVDLGRYIDAHGFVCAGQWPWRWPPDTAERNPLLKKMKKVSRIRLKKKRFS
jgi:hypothetical protein